MEVGDGCTASGMRRGRLIEGVKNRKLVQRPSVDRNISNLLHASGLKGEHLVRCGEIL